MTSRSSKMSDSGPPSTADDKFDLGTAALNRMLFLGNPNLIYNAEEWDKIPSRNQKYVERMADRLRGPILDFLLNSIRERYQNLDELPSKYAIAFSAANYLRRCALSERHEICPEFYFYSYDDRLMFIDVFRGLKDFAEKSTLTESEIIQRTASAKGFGRLIKQIVRWFYDGRLPRKMYDEKRPFEKDWQKVFKHRGPRQVIIDICANTCVHGWKHQDIIKMMHLPSSEPWNHGGQLFTLLAWNGPRRALQVIQDEAPPDYVNREKVRELIKLIRAIDEIKHSDDTSAIAKILREEPELCNKIDPPGIVPVRHCMNEEVTAVFVDCSPLRQLFRYLPSWNARGYFEAGKPHLLAIVERLKNSNFILNERLSPSEVFMAWKRYERSAGPSTTTQMASLTLNDCVTAGTEAVPKKRKRATANMTFHEPSPLVLDAFAAAFSTSFQNFQPTSGKKFFIAVDVRPSVLQQPIFGAKYLKTVEAISCLAATAIRKEYGQIMAFAANGLAPVSLLPGMDIEEIAAVLCKIKPGGVTLTAPISKAKKTGSNFLIVITDRPPEQSEWLQQLRNAVQKYEKEEKCSGVKVVAWFVNHRRGGGQTMPVNDEVLVVNGWNQFVLEVIWSFARGQLDDVEVVIPQKKKHSDDEESQ